ncbi:ubiquitin-specific protease, putative [Phytophthora infestans T30-4]|uniref:ubiquitinyl hydrolase 1 n=1 Tax=Phytophthora infestans (strain T30-4) TaxID=403677 RepID=D0MTA4_PHYIT|nr:ubiquitin-specific protease, putative [Phytophthora infestans T30-4]EEY61201.1 ubiquitin-specific protease, putative [Phytophthora infestans T30-4]|eukprot:XP_002908118.1 ubiquitin-specific protease, putative [Phytophthora infestans T30-4]
MDRAPAQDKDSQKRRKKSQESTSGLATDMEEEELELFHVVQEDLRHKSTVGWQNAVKVLNSAYQHIDRPESQAFLDDAFQKIVSIMLDQHASKIGSFEKSCVTQCLSLAVPLVIAQMKAGKYFQTLPVLTMIFSKKKTFYKDLRTSAMIGSYWNKVPGSPEVRAQCIEAFCEMKGFHLLLSTLELLMQNHREGDELEAAMDSEDIRILLQALLEFRTSVPETICTKISVLIMTYFTKISDFVLKKESSDAVGAVIGIIRRLVDAGIVSSEATNALWLDITERYVESTSLPLRLFGLEQINQIVNCARASRAFPPRYFVRNAGTAAVNGVYTLKANSTSATYVFRQQETGQVFTLFCCTMKSGLKWWFISEADKMQPGSDQDIDYYQHQSQYEEYLPPTHNWIPTGKGEAPAPELVAESVQENDDEDRSRLDYKLSAWVVEKKILEEIFGDRIHREIVSRSALLVKFLADSNKLDTHSIDVIWQSCIQKDQTLVHEIHNLLIATVPFLTNELLLHLVESIHASLLRSLEKNEPFPELISFLQRLATNSPSFLMDRNVNVTTAILQLLWSIQMHCSIANIRLSRSLRDFFQEGLRSEYGEPLRKAFLNECLEGIKKSCSLTSSAPDAATSPSSTLIPPALSSSSSSSVALTNSAELSAKDATASKSLELLKFLIDSYRADQALVVETLNSEHGLVSLLFDELATFVARSTDKQSPSYRTAIGHRLELIHYIHVKSPKLELSIPQIERLWHVLSSSPAEREYCLIFFNQTSMKSGTAPGTSTVGGSISSAFNLDVCFYVFNELLCKQTNFRTLGCMGYKCFNTYFVGLNAQRKLMQHAEEASECGSLNLLGMDALWRIAFEAPLEVAEMATRELLRVYERSSDEPTHNDDSESDEAVKDFLARVFKQLSTVEDSTPDSLKQVQQCSSLLAGLVSSARKKQNFVSHGLSGRGAYFTIKIIAQRIPSSNTSGTGMTTAASSHDNAVRTMQAAAYSNQTLLHFRKRIEKLVGHPMLQTKILSSGSAITGDQKTLADLQITESSELRVLMFNSVVQRSSSSVMDQDQVMTSGKESSSSSSSFSPKRHPGLVIARDASYFGIMFRVLDIVEGHAVHELLWAFLKQIPTSEELLNRVSNIGATETSDGDVNMSPLDDTANGASKPDWSSLVKGISSHQAIYTLQIMDALLLPSDAAKIPFAHTYLQRFISGGGFHEVLSYFINANFHESSFNEGAAVALRILKFCLFDSGHDNGLYSATANGDAPVETPRSKIIVEQSRYDQLVLKIAELVVSEYTRVEEKIPAKKTAYRILIDAVKTVESIVSIANDAAAKYIKALEPRAIIVNIFTKFESEQVRDQWLSSLESVCKASDAAAEVVFEECIQSVGRIESVTAPCDQYTRMLCLLARLEGGKSSSYCQKLALAVVTKLRRGFSSKFLACNERSGEVLIGFLEFLREVLVVHADVRAGIARDIVDVVYEECLFTLPSEDRRRCPLCVSLETRRPAFKLLASAISSDARILHDLHGRLTKLFTQSDALRFKWGQENNIETRGNGEHVGLKNQGCSCYMNSFLQQLFMHPTLRQGLLGAKVAPRPTPQEPTKAEAEKYPERLIGCRVALECLGGRVYEANVVGYDDLSGQHTMRYENGGEATFVLAEGRPGNENGRYVILQPELTGTDATLEVLRQLQRTFCYLRDSEMRYFNPKAFVDSCTCLNLEFSVYQQNDATEFCDKLLDRLETGLKTTPQGTRCLQDVMGGKLISQKLPKDCGHRYEREEPFIRLELQIRGKESIEESLSAFVEGELMDGDNKVECELCATKKAAVRRTCFGSLPNLLILHLKRFDLDYTTFETVKLNNRCSFPMRLSMKPYTKAGIEEQEARSNLQQDRGETSADEDMASDDSSDSDEFMADVNGDTPAIPASSSASTKSDPNYEYRLKGILVHSGVAQGGHYYSFIYDHMSEKWFKYDDEDVTPFDPANIEAECFGGVQRRSWHGSNNSMEMEVFSNALMLFYEKVIPVEPEVAPATESEASVQVVTAAPDEERCEYEAEVWKSNEVFLQNSYLFDVEFHEFLREMVQSQYIKDSLVAAAEDDIPMAISPSPGTNVVTAPPAAPVALAVPALAADEEIQVTLTDIGVEFVLSVLLHSREKHGIARWITLLASKFTRSKTICVRFFSALSTSKRVFWLRGLLFECPDSIARQSFVHLVSRALTAYEVHRKEEQATVNEARSEAAAAADTTVIRAFLETIASFLDQTSIMQQSHLEECFMLLRNCAEISATARTQLQQLEMIARLINFFLCDRGPSALKDAFPSSTLQPTASRYASPDYQYLLEAVTAILGLPRRTTEPLLTENSTQYPHRTVLSEKAEQALTEIFEDYQTPGGASGNLGLGLEELKKFFSVSLSSATTSPAVEQQARHMLTKYGTPLDGFMLYYTDMAASSTKSVLQDLRAFGFSEDLQRHSLSSGDVPTGAQILEGLSPLSRGALLNDVFFDSALEEEAETTCELLLRLSLGDHETSTRLLRALLHCLQSTETGWKGQPVVDACALAVQRVLGYECDYQKELVELALVHSDYGLLSSARSRENLRSRYVNTAHVPLFVYRQLVLVLELRARVPAVNSWLADHRNKWEWLYEWLRIESLQPSLGGRLSQLRREPAKLEMLWRLGEALGISYQEEQRRYVVEGAGYAAVNGVYVSTSHVHDNCLTYACVKSDIEYTLFRCCMPSKARRWYISYSPNKNLLGTMSDEDFYFVQSHIDDESPPVDGWKVWVKNEKAKAPVPTVRLHSSTVAALDGEGDAADATDSVDGFMARGGFDDGSSAPTAPSPEMVVETVDVDADAETVEYDDSEDEIRDSNERFRAVHLDTQEDGSSTDDFM